MPPPTIAPDLTHRLENAAPYDLIDVNIFLTGEPAAAVLGGAMLDSDEGSAAAAVGDAVEAVKRAADANQRDLIDFLTGQAGAALAASFSDD